MPGINHHPGKGDGGQGAARVGKRVAFYRQARSVRRNNEPAGCAVAAGAQEQRCGRSGIEKIWIGGIQHGAIRRECRIGRGAKRSTHRAIGKARKPLRLLRLVPCQR